MRLQNTLAFLSSVLGFATSASDDEPLREIPKSVLTIQAGKVRYATVAYSADGKQLAIINDQKTIGIHNAATGKQVRSIATTAEIMAVRFAPDGKHVVSSGRQGIRFWRLSDGKEARALGKPSHTRCSFSPMGGLLASGHMKGATIWNTTTWKEVGQFTPENRGWYSSASFHPDARRVATCGRTRAAIEIWDVTTGKIVQVVETDRKPVYTAVFSPNGRKLAGTTTASVQVFELKTGKQLFALPRQNYYVAAFSRDSRRIATASREHTINIHNANDGNELLRLKGHTNTVLHVSFSPDRKHLASVSRDGTVRIWNLSMDKKVDQP